MALVSKKVSKTSMKLSRAANDSQYDTKYFENKEKLLKKIGFFRTLFLCLCNYLKTEFLQRFFIF